MNKRIITLNTRNTTEQVSLGFNAKSATVINHTPFRVFVRFGNFDIPDENNKDIAVAPGSTLTVPVAGWYFGARLDVAETQFIGAEVSNCYLIFADAQSDNPLFAPKFSQPSVIGNGIYPGPFVLDFDLNGANNWMQSFSIPDIIYQYITLYIYELFVGYIVVYFPCLDIEPIVYEVVDTAPVEIVIPLFAGCFEFDIFSEGDVSGTIFIAGHGSAGNVTTPKASFVYDVDFRQDAGLWVSNDSYYIWTTPPYRDADGWHNGTYFSAPGADGVRGLELRLETPGGFDPDLSLFAFVVYWRVTGQPEVTASGWTIGQFYLDGSGSSPNNFVFDAPEDTPYDTSPRISKWYRDEYTGVFSVRLQWFANTNCPDIEVTRAIVFGLGANPYT